MTALSSLNPVLVEDNQLAFGAVGAGVILAATVVYYHLSSKDNERGFPRLRGIQLYHAWNFFQRRYSFLRSSFEQNFEKSFSFNVLHHNVIALNGDDARRIFYSNSHLNLGRGYRILMGTIPRPSDADITTVEQEEAGRAVLHKRVNKLLHKDRMQDKFPALVQAITKKADEWMVDGARAGRIDPVPSIFDLVFIMTTRILACDELAKNEADLKKIAELLMTVQSSATPVSLLLPWLPSTARKEKKQATTALYTLLYKYVEARRHAEPTNDAIDIQIAEGDTTQSIVGFVMAMLVASIINTGNTSYWALIHLVMHTEWREKCKKEIQGLFSRHLGDVHPSATLSEKLGGVPVSAWEDELPIVEACFRETQRIFFTNVALRRNVREDINIGKQVVKVGDFLVYSPANVHLDPEFYPNPLKYDPDRWLRPDPVPKVPFPFLAWGAGRHPCAGVKFAKLQIKLILAIFLVGYEFDLVDEDGKFPNPLPVPDPNGFHQIHSLGDTCYLKIKKIVQ